MKNVHELWDSLAGIGWLTDLGEDRARQLREELEEAWELDPGSAWTRLADVALDVECVFEPEEQGEGPYVTALRRYAESSRDLFHPSNLCDELDPDLRVARVGFEHDGREYRCEVPWHDDFFREEVHELVNRALADSGAEPRFLFLPSDSSQQLYLALVRPEVLEAARELGVLPATDLEELERAIERGAAEVEEELFGQDGLLKR